MSHKSLLLILGNQLFDYKFFKNLSQDVFMCEDHSLCTYYKFHKHKIIFFLSSMRHFANYIKTKNKNLYYYKIEKRKNFIEQLEKILKKYNEIEFYEIEDHFFEQEILSLCKKIKIKVTIHQSPMFLNSRVDFEEYLKEAKRPFMNTFYIQSRKKFKILIHSDNTPLHNKWSFDEKNRKKIPKSYQVISNSPPLIKDEITEEVKKQVDILFKEHPGESHNYWIPNNRKDAIKWFKVFLESKLKDFGNFQDSIDTRDDFLYHSIISPFLNIGFLTPKEVIREVIKYKDIAPYNSIEGFIRQVLGWREFVRGIYHNYDEQMSSSNFWGHQRKLSIHWYKGDTGIPPLDDAIKKTIKYGYAHHIERLMIIGNIMLLLEIHPKEVYKWFMEMFVDSSDWVMAANVYGMSQFSEGGIFATKPYICGSNYLLKMSHYKKDDWCDALDGLYWSFIDKNQSFFRKNPRLSMMVSLLEKIHPERRKKIEKAAKKMQAKLTTEYKESL